MRSHDDEPMIVLELETMKNAYACAGVRAREEVITIAGSEMRVGNRGYVTMAGGIESVVAQMGGMVWEARSNS